MRPNPLSDLPKQWLELSAYDLVFLSLEDLEQLQSTPESAMAIEHWTKAGHSLYVYDPDEGVIAEGLDRVDAVLHGEFAGWQAGVVPNANRIEEYDNHSQRNGARFCPTRSKLRLSPHSQLRPWTRGVHFWRPV